MRQAKKQIHHDAIRSCGEGGAAAGPRRLAREGTAPRPNLFLHLQGPAAPGPGRAEILDAE